MIPAAASERLDEHLRTNHNHSVPPKNKAIGEPRESYRQAASCRPGGDRPQGHGRAGPAPRLLRRGDGRTRQDPGPRSRGRQPSPRPPATAVGFHRQRRLPRPGSAYRGRGHARRHGEDPRRRGRRGLRWSRAARQSTSMPGTTRPRSTRRPRSSPCFPKAVHRPHVAGVQRGPAGDGRRDGVGGGRLRAGLQLYRAYVRNQAKLAYNSVAAWLEGGRRRRPWRPCRASTRICACRTRWPSA